MKSRKFMTAAVLGLAVLLLQGLQIPGAPTLMPLQAAQVSAEGASARAAVDRYCVTCHNSRVTGTATASGVVLDKADLNQVAENPELWEKVVRKLRTGSMP